MRWLQYVTVLVIFTSALLFSACQDDDNPSSPAPVDTTGPDDTTGTEISYITFSKKYNFLGYDEGYALTQTSDSCYFLFGITSEPGEYNFIAQIAKIDTNGNEIWRINSNIIDMYSTYTMFPTEDNGVVINSHSIDHNNFHRLTKIDTEGNVTWSHEYSLNSWNFRSTAIPTNDGGFAMLGTVDNESGAVEHVSVIKTDPLGTESWNRSIVSNWIISLCELQDGSIAVTCITDLSAPTAELKLVVIDPNGTSSQEYTVNTEFDPSYIQFSSMNCNSDNKIILMGYNPHVSNVPCIFLCLDNVGNVVSYQEFTDGLQHLYNDVKITNANELILTGKREIGSDGYQLLIVKMDSNYNLIWERYYGDVGSDNGSSLIVTLDGGLAVLGSCPSSESGYSPDFYLIKTDPDGLVNEE